MAELAARHYREMGYDIKKEVHIGEGKAVDLVATKYGKRAGAPVMKLNGKSRMKFFQFSHFFF